MARARNIKPGICENEDLAECSIPARYLFACIPMYADREGRLEDRPRKLKKYVFGGDTIDIEPLLRELASHGVPRFIVRYQNEDGSFIQITGFNKHQSPHYSEKPSLIKPPPLQEKLPDIEEPNSRSSAPIKRGSQRPDSLIPDSPIPSSLNPELVPFGDLSGKPDAALNGKAQFLPEAEQVIAYLNRSTGGAFRFKSPAGKLTASADMVIARLKDGYTGEQLREVVMLKAEQWKGDEKMSEFLRPKTLFAKSNFEQYLGELGNV